MSRVMFFVFVLSVLAGVVAADEYKWTGGGDDNRWDNPYNWEVEGECPYTLPGSLDRVVIPEGTPECQIFGQVRVHNLINHGTIGVQPGATSVGITAYLYVNNEGTISTGGASVSIKTDNGDLNNSGTIEGSQVFIRAGHEKSIHNQSGGTIQSTVRGGHVFLYVLYGDVVNDGAIHAGSEGNVHIYADKIIENGSTIAGTSGAKIVAKAAQPVLLGTVTFIADSMVIASGDSIVLGDTLHFRGRTIVVRDVNWGIVQADHALEFYTSADGIVDFSGVDQQDAIYCNFAPVNIFSNNIVAPAEGLDHIIFPNYNVSPADITIIGGYIGESFSIGAAGESSSFTLMMQNQSTAAKVLDYAVSSVRGWTAPFSNSTPLIEPFGFSDVEVVYTLPGGTTAGTEDTVMTILSIGSTFADTSMSIITCMATVETLFHIEVSPPSVTLEPLGNQQFSARGYDVNDNEIFITPIWSADGGEITSEGLYTAPSTEGDYTVTASVKGSQVTGTASVHVGPCVLPGDVNGDGSVNVLDVLTIVNAILELDPTPFLRVCADCNADGAINILDILGVVNVILGTGECEP